MRILHAADLHLDSPLSGLAEYEGAPVGEVRRATRRAFIALVDYCLENRVALLLLAGDLYDGDFRDFSTGLFFVEQMARLREGAVQVVWLRGNHDAESRMTRHLRLPENVQELRTSEPQTIIFPDLDIAVHGQGYGERDVTTNLASSYPKPISGALNIGVLHTALEGRPGHANYAPTTLGELVARGYDYWALGHVHTREVLAQDPYVVFPGNLQGRHIRETGQKGGTLISVRDGRIDTVAPIELDVVRWAHVEVSMTSVDSLDDALDRVQGAIGRATEAAGDRVLACRVTLTGETSAHKELSVRERLASELRAVAVDAGSVYLEKVEVRTTGPVAASLLEARVDAMAELFRSIDEAKADITVREELRASALNELSGLPYELVEKELDAWEDIIEEARRLLDARLLESGEGGGGEP